MKISEPKVEFIQSVGDDLTIVNAARVSFAKESDWDYDIKHDGRCNERLSDKDQKLISYLGTHGHWSPFAHTSLTFRISAPIFVARQLVKHQVGGVWNEVSRRYVDDEPSFYLPKMWRGKPENAKQGSSGVVDLHGDMSNYDDYYSPESVCEFCFTAYDKMISAGVAPEQARMILPQNTMTEWWWTGSLMFFARVCKQRLDVHAQEETRDIAQQINDKIPKEFSVSWKALMNE